MRKKIVKLIAHHDEEMKPERSFLRKKINLLGKYTVESFFKIKSADISALAETQHYKLATLSECSRLFDEIIADNDCCFLSDLAVNGDDLITLGIPQGKKVRAALELLLQAALSGECPNEKTALISYLQRSYTPHSTETYS
jgi:tRNA nucleotidyltransferase (CCA-adding enzyme)